MSLGFWESNHIVSRNTHPLLVPLFMNNGFSDPPYSTSSIATSQYDSGPTREILPPSLHWAALDIQVNIARLMCVFFIVIALRADCLASVLSLSYKRLTLQPSTLTEPLVIDSLFRSLIKRSRLCVVVHMCMTIFPPCYNKSCCAAKASSAACAGANSPWRVSSLHVRARLIQGDQTDRHMLFLCPLLSLR